MNVRERIQFYNRLAKHLPAIVQQNKIQGKFQKNPLILSKTITKICEKNNFELNVPQKHLDKDSNINSKEVISANKIKHYFRVHLKKLENMEENGLYTNKGFIKTTYKGNDKSIYNREYYHSRNKDHPIVYKPNEISVGVENGSFKTLTRKDHRFVALEPVDISDRFETDNNFNDINNIRSIKTGLAVSTKLIIAANAGICVSKYIKCGNIIPCEAFKNAVNDLKTLHKQNGYLRDIKPENTTYDGKQINFIDVEDRISKDTHSNHSTVKFKIYGEPCIYTKHYITSDLLQNIYDKHSELSNNKDVVKYLKSADEYAFLLTFIAATSKSKGLRNTIISPTWARNPQKMSAINKVHLTKWVDQHVKSQDRHTVNLLLSAPDKHAILRNDVYLSDMLLFK